MIGFGHANRGKDAVHYQSEIVHDRCALSVHRCQRKADRISRGGVVCSGKRDLLCCLGAKRYGSNGTAKATVTIDSQHAHIAFVEINVANSLLTSVNIADRQIKADAAQGLVKQLIFCKSDSISVDIIFKFRREEIFDRTAASEYDLLILSVIRAVGNKRAERSLSRRKRIISHGSVLTVGKIEPHANLTVPT